MSFFYVSLNSLVTAFLILLLIFDINLWTFNRLLLLFWMKHSTNWDQHFYKNFIHVIYWYSISYQICYQLYRRSHQDLSYFWLIATSNFKYLRKIKDRWGRILLRQLVSLNYIKNTSIISTSYRSKSFLASCIPYLKLTYQSINLMPFKSKINSDCR